LSEFLFISDLHLAKKRQDLVYTFLHFLKHRARSAKALYILGDLFDAWVGDDCIQPWQTEIIAALKEYSKQHELYFMRGNRDFLINSRFCQHAGCTLLPDYYLFQPDNTISILLLHGDTLCTKDKKYLRYRSFAYHPLTRKLFQLLPKWLRQKIAARVRSISKKNNHDKPKDHNTLSITDAQPDAVVQKMVEFNVGHIIHGHTHRPAQHIHEITHQDGSTQQAIRWVLGDWGTHWWVLSYKKGVLTQKSYSITNEFEHVFSGP